MRKLSLMLLLAILCVPLYAEDKIEKKRLEGLIKVNACALSEYKKEFKLLW